MVDGVESGIKIKEAKTRRLFKVLLLNVDGLYIDLKFNK